MPGDTVDPLNMEPFTVESVESFIFPHTSTDWQHS